MSLTIQQIILDAKRLAGRLKERETEADALLTETQTAYRQIHTMKQVNLSDSFCVVLHDDICMNLQYLVLSCVDIGYLSYSDLCFCIS